MYRSHILTLLLVIVVILVSAAPALADTTYVVQTGDTLSSIARRFGTTVQAIVEANNIVNPNLIVAGQTLIIPGDGVADPAASSPALPTPANEDLLYTVEPGDSLYKIAVRFGVTVQAIVLANDLANPGLIVVGQTLIIPGAAGSSSPSATPPPAPAPAATPAPPPPAAPAANVLPNSSWEDGWYNQDGVAELQLPIGWFFEWDEGDNPLAPTLQNIYYRPEVRVLYKAYLPPDEQAAFIWDGNYTVKSFKGYGAVSFRLLTDLYLQPGTYLFEVNVFPDLVVAYDGGTKVWATDPLAGEVRFIVGAGGSGWISPTAGQKNTLTHTFTITTPQTIRLGAAMRGRYALANNGWFMDDWSLTRTGD